MEHRATVTKPQKRTPVGCLLNTLARKNLKTANTSKKLFCNAFSLFLTTAENPPQARFEQPLKPFKASFEDFPLLVSCFSVVHSSRSWRRSGGGENWSNFHPLYLFYFVFGSSRPKLEKWWWNFFFFLFRSWIIGVFAFVFFCFLCFILRENQVGEVEQREKLKFPSPSFLVFCFFSGVSSKIPPALFLLKCFSL